MLWWRVGMGGPYCASKLMGERDPSFPQGGYWVGRG